MFQRDSPLKGNFVEVSLDYDGTSGGNWRKQAYEQVIEGGVAQRREHAGGRGEPGIAYE
jgi:hypothetical protein